MVAEAEGRRRCRGVQQNRLGDVGEVEQNPSLRSKRTISVRMMRKAIIADMTPELSALTGAEEE